MSDNVYHITLAGHTIRCCDDAIELPILAGHDVSRGRGVLVADVTDRGLADTVTGEPIEATDHGAVLRGWGDIDGPAYSVGPGAEINQRTYIAALLYAYRGDRESVSVSRVNEVIAQMPVTRAELADGLSVSVEELVRMAMHDVRRAALA